MQNRLLNGGGQLAEEAFQPFHEVKKKRLIHKLITTAGIWR